MMAHHIRVGNWAYLYPIMIKTIQKLQNFLFLPVGLLFVLLIRIIRPWLLVRVNMMSSERLGHFAGNPEVYLCGLDAGIDTPKTPFVDLWYHNWPICNKQLARMWRRVLHIGPAWVLGPISYMNSLIPGGGMHRIKHNTAGDPNEDRDIHNLLDRFPPHLEFLPEEEARGEAGLRVIGIAAGAPFVCLNVRDDSYLQNHLPWWNWSYHDYRNCNIQNYILAAQELVKRGYYVVRMGAAVREAMNVSHPMIIDYAANGMRSDFMDIYLGAKCAFCISNGTGFDGVPYIFRRPIVYVDHVPLGIINTYSSKFLATTKKHWLRKEKRFMTFREIFESGAGLGMSSREDGLGIGVDVIESSPEEIAAVVLEMESRSKGTWQATEEDDELQRRFWAIFPKTGHQFAHGEIRSHIGADFLRKHRDWLN